MAGTVLGSAGRKGVIVKLLSLGFVTAIAVAGFLSVQAPVASAAVAMHTPSTELTSSVSVKQVGYYYYRGRRYPYRYHGMYFNHRYYRGGRYHYY
jgi:hypothetical protein